LCGKENNIYQDHDHDNDLIRGLGMFKDDPGLLAMAIDYLKSWRHRHAALSPKDRKTYRYRVGRRGPVYSPSIHQDLEVTDRLPLAYHPRKTITVNDLSGHPRNTTARKQSGTGQQYGSQLPFPFASESRREL
jgi:hypothetical protein